MSSIDNCEFEYKIEKQIRETEDEFIYTAISPFCETILEKKVSKKELEKILRKGMQKTIPLDRIKQAIDEIEKLYEDFDAYDPDALGSYASHVYEILDKLIESEGK